MENNDDTNIYTYKIILIGDSYVGKTSLIIRFCEDKYEPNGLATVGIDTKTKYFKRKDKKVELQIWDTAGQERFKSLSKSCCNSMDGIIFVYDMGNKTSFQNIKVWYNNLKNIVDFKKVGLILVGNKCDLDNPEVNEEIVKDFCNSHNMNFIEASAKNNINVNEVFTTLVDIMFKLDEESNGLYRRSRSKIGKIITASTIEGEEILKKKKNCC